MMIVDISPSALDYDASTDTAVLSFHEPAPPSSSRAVSAQLLLDAAGHLVGVDLGDAYEGRRVVAMLGAHENVATTKATRAELREERPKDADGLLSIRIAGARAAMRGGEKNPYL